MTDFQGDRSSMLISTKAAVADCGRFSDFFDEQLEFTTGRSRSRQVSRYFLLVYEFDRRIPRLVAGYWLRILTQGKLAV